jgi:hypothetical protein
MAAYVTYGRVQRCATHAGRWAVMGLAAVALFGLAACHKAGVGGGSDEMGWARAALERNDRIEIVATDPSTSTFTVRVKDTGDLRTIRADQVIAALPGAMPAAVAAPAGTPASSESSQAASGESATASNTEQGQAAGAAAEQSPTPGAPTANSNGAPAAASNAAPATAASPSNTAASASVPRTGFQSTAAPQTEVPNPNSDVTSITPGGKVLESGPGYAIKMASAKSTPQVAARTERSSTTSAVERRHDPIICQGQRMLHIDNRNLEFDGDAVAAQDGCEIYITNSHLIAKNGVGVSARHANVHIDNSQIEGDTASIDASEGAQVYLEASTFKGVSRRLDNSSFHDLGGNVWN